MEGPWLRAAHSRLVRPKKCGLAVAPLGQKLFPLTRLDADKFDDDAKFLCLSKFFSHSHCQTVEIDKQNLA